MHRIFLGGTMNHSTWRDELIAMLPSDIEYFNPVVSDWTEECIAIENEEKEIKCDIHLYVITPKMTGVYSIAEAVESAFTLGKLAIFCVLNNDEYPGFSVGQLKSLDAVGKLVERHSGVYLKSLEDVIKYIISY